MWSILSKKGDFMAVGPIGNTIFTNQMTPTVSSVQNAHNNRVEFQNMVAQATIQEKDEKVLEVRPTEENHEIDPESEHQKDEANRETKRSKKEQHNAQEEDEEIKSYVDSLEPLNCAGGFALEGIGGKYIEKIDGCFSNVMGLSLPWLRKSLIKQGIFA